MADDPSLHATSTSPKVVRLGALIGSDKRYLWDGGEIVEERDGVNTGVVTKRYFGAGVQEVAANATTNLFYSRDHLGSVREVTDANGNLVARYDYDAWGRQTQTLGTYKADWGYAGYFVHRASKLNLTWYRAYDPDLGRWVSRDPIEEDGGANMYLYVGNKPINFHDPYGLCQKKSPCKDPCGDAFKNGDVGPYTLGGVVCCNGRKYVCVWRYPYNKSVPPFSDVQSQQIINQCIKEHETDHLDDYDCPSPKLRPPFKSTKDQKTEERKAYAAQTRCLKRSKGACKTQDCRDAIDKNLIDIQTIVETYFSAK